MRRIATFLVAALAVGPLAGGAEPAPATRGPWRPLPEPRTVLALYDGAYAAYPSDTPIHTLVEMPLNHLGLRVQYHDIRTGLPPIDCLGEMRGVLTWFARDALPRPQEYLQWLQALSTTGKPLVVIGPLGASAGDDGTLVSRDVINRAIEPFGWRYDGGWTTTTYGVRYRTVDADVMGFERRLPTVIPPYLRVTTTSKDMTVALGVEDRSGAGSVLVAIGPRGAFVAPDFAYFADRTGPREFRQWYLNPFVFFGRAFRADALPKPDTTTLSGRRIFYSHIDGDGWRNLTQIEPYRTRYAIAARVVLEKVLRPAPDLPVTVGAIGADIDPRWHGTAESIAVASEIYRLPHVEAATHTYSHPLVWKAFDPAARKAVAAADAPKQFSHGPDALQVADASKPRMYDTRPFTLPGEVDQAAAAVQALLPAGKKVALMQWSGDTQPFEAVLSRARAFGLANINGGDTRYDGEFPSATWVSPIGLRVGRELQVYASNSNENTYTELWRGRFFGFSFLPETVRNTGAPRRLKPFNLYYHMYSGERLASLNAVLANIAYARTLPLAAIETSRFSRIAEGFFSTELDRVGTRAWRVRDRRGLQTLRVDDAARTGVDFAASRGVVGQRHELGSLFVALDEAEAAPIVALKPIAAGGGEPSEGVAYLVESRWRVLGVQRAAAALRYTTEGFGPAEATWQWPAPGPVRIRWGAASGRAGELRAVASATGRLTFSLPVDAGSRVAVELSQER
jgi:hypothetical protein